MNIFILIGILMTAVPFILIFVFGVREFGLKQTSISFLVILFFMAWISVGSILLEIGFK